MSIILLELELSELEDGSASPLEYIAGDIREFFENMGYKVIRSSHDEVEEE